MNRFIYLLFFNFFAFNVCAQSCLYEEYIEHKENEYPGYVEATNAAFEQAVNFSNLKAADELIRVPVVVHVLYHNAEQNISDEVIQAQLQILNDDFQGLNSDASNTRAAFLDVVGNPNIEFYLADTDPDGFPSNGITRTETYKNSFTQGFELTDLSSEFEAILDSVETAKYTASGGIDAWDTKRYLNIWVANLSIDFYSFELSLLGGVGTPPYGLPNWDDVDPPENFEEVDGVLVNTASFGIHGNSDAGSVGRVLVHEVGHYLGLRHSWGDGGCSSDDGIEDTPPMASSAAPTELVIVTCESLLDKDTCDEDELPDMFENFMDYAPQDCQSLFTAGQAALMRSVLEIQRAELIELAVEVGLEELKSTTRIFPNPATDQVQIQGLENESYYLRIFSAAGNLVRSIRHTSKSIDIADLNSGLYFLEITSQERVIAARLKLLVE